MFGYRVQGIGDLLERWYVELAWEFVRLYEYWPR